MPGSPSRFMPSLLLPLVPLALALSACSSRDEKAAAFASMAANAFQQGQIAAAGVQISRALALRDDVSEYWLLKGQIAIAQQDFPGAFAAYENVLTLDRGNVEAMVRMSQIALNADVPDRAERFADQLALLRPGDPLPMTVKAAAALKRSDKKTAAKLLDQVLAANPQDAFGLLVKGKLLLADDDYAGAIKAVEASLVSPGDPGGRLSTLKDLYVRAGDADGYLRTVARLARAYPEDVSAQMDYAAALFDSGDNPSGLAVTQRVLTLRPGDVALSGTILAMWLDADGGAMPADAIAAGANASDVLQTKAIYAQYANEIGRPDIAAQILDDATVAGDANAANSDAKAARAYALALQGNRAAGQALVDGVLGVDPDQPRALFTRARLRQAAGDIDGALQDARRVSADDPDNATARLLLTDLLLKRGEQVLALSALRDGINGRNAQPRLVARLVTLLRKTGREAEAVAALTDFQRANPVNPQAKRMRARLA